MKLPSRKERGLYGSQGPEVAVGVLAIFFGRLVKSYRYFIIVGNPTFCQVQNVNFTTFFSRGFRAEYLSADNRIKRIPRLKSE